MEEGGEGEGGEFSSENARTEFCQTKYSGPGEML